MTAFSLDYTLASLRGCYEGWEYFGSKSRGDLMGCLGAWYSGELARQRRERVHQPRAELPQRQGMA